MGIFTIVESPIGEIFISATDNGICCLSFGRIEKAQLFKQFKQKFVQDNYAFVEIISELKRYFAGKKVEFNFKVDFSIWTNFQQDVWKEVRNIPYGQKVTYKEIAIRIGKHKSARAVGQANSKNPVLLIIPCHRVVGSDNKLGGFSAGKDIKKRLLQMEEQASKD